MVLQDITNVPQINYYSPEYSDDDTSDSDADYEEQPKRCLGLCILWYRCCRTIIKTNCN